MNKTLPILILLTLLTLLTLSGCCDGDRDYKLQNETYNKCFNATYVEEARNGKYVTDRCMEIARSQSYICEEK